jgi:hypothetical protein
MAAWAVHKRRRSDIRTQLLDDGIDQNHVLLFREALQDAGRRHVLQGQLQLLGDLVFVGQALRQRPGTNVLIFFKYFGGKKLAILLKILLVHFASKLLLVKNGDFII